VEQARAAAERNGIDTRMFDLREGGASPVGDKSSVKYFPADRQLERSADGRIVVRLYDTGLANERTAVGSIAHELSHIRSVLDPENITGEMNSEDDAELPALYAEEYFK